ncbi:hypothetical protein PILCRDRAFT_93667 [Piloderma croceum F 1598]|uniref:RING-type domain-containing protein n=1 Tax=Piloderma croceum (strain F 1598) TaxID=765440 RepID=A0A0C3EGV6_PILCF|nr:hypothetical protein PILCRDRAFT_93667 [Piloderma croceum F 1598]
MFATLCTVEADTSQLINATRPHRGQGGVLFYEQIFSVVLLFGLTELKAQLCWMEDGEEKRGPAKEFNSGTLPHSGLRALSLLITADYSVWEWYSEIVHQRTSSRTFHRKCGLVQGLRRDTKMTKTPSVPTPDLDLERGTESLEAGGDPSTSGPTQPQEQAWYETQVECAICLSDFAKGDTVRVLPCHHIFHLDEVDA